MYNYKEQRTAIFTEEGQIQFLAIRDKAEKLLKLSGAFMFSHVIIGAPSTGSSFDYIACVDRLVELGEIREVTSEKVAGQDKVYVSNRRN